MTPSKSLIYASLPTGLPIAGTHLVVETREIDLTTPLPPSTLLLRTLYASFDPFLLGRMRDPSIPWAYSAFVPGNPIETYILAKILKSSSSNFKEGDIMHGLLPVQEYTFVSADVAKALEVVEVREGIPMEMYLGALGMPGLSAYSSFYGIGKPKSGETIFISSAAGAVGQLVGQLAKRKGLTVLGSVGSEEKKGYILKELGFDGAFSYKEESAGDALGRLAPGGLDLYYDNVGGEQLEAALGRMRVFGRIVASGMISQYSKSDEEIYKIKNLMQIVTQRLTIQGFVWNDPDMGPKYKDEHKSRIEGWLLEGSIKAPMDVVEGIEGGPEGLVRMLKGENFGKVVLKV